MNPALAQPRGKMNVADVDPEIPKKLRDFMKSFDLDSERRRGT